MMITKQLLGEFLHEVENTRKLLKAIPDDALEYKPSENSWTTAQLASHIAEVYNWYYNTIEDNVFDMGAYKYDKGDITKASNILSKFEENIKKAQHSLENLKEERLYDNWSMVLGDKELMAPMPRIQVIRGFLMNHLYHHRGEMIVYLRATGNKVPGLYGPTYEESLAFSETQSV
ncbi:DinB family protein [Flavobacterium sp. H122]|uniref:DinB family protein n=1 Tax=Flavobacterium sp. H122 TaxID=2529860 RepID=UPI0020BDA97F|nr:DinB family protein [Flavobacterium sp. H122]